MTETQIATSPIVDSNLINNLIDSYKDITAYSMSDLQGKTLISMALLTTPIGSMFVCATDKGVCLLEFFNRKDMTGQLNRLEALINGVIVIAENEYTLAVKKQLDQYFIGERHQFELPLFIPGTQFQQQVWQCLTTIDYGTTSSYQQQAENLGNPKAIRAMASANGRNRLAIIIPCHRVIGKDGSLTGYAGGLERKQWLLDHEKKHKI